MSATSLAHLWQSQDKRWEAHDLLALVYGWFTEGFDTADLKEAKALLEELADEQWSRIWHLQAIDVRDCLRLQSFFCMLRGRIG